MTLYSETFYSNEISPLFTDRYQVGQLLQVEAALAWAQGANGVIPQTASNIIVNVCGTAQIDIDALKANIKLGGNAAIPLVNQLTRAVKNTDFDASKYVHFGATSQDIIDTATMLTIKECLLWFDKKLSALESSLLQLTIAHKTTLMIGRTLLQHATPMTFSLKSAGWLESVSRSKARLKSMRNRVLAIQLGGAVGSGSQTITTSVQHSFAEYLGLENALPWQSQRDNLNEFASFLGILSGTLGKMAKDISILMQTEVGEVFEGAEEGKGGSTIMPHKRNPVGCALILSNALRTPHLVATLLAAMPQENERSAGLWHAEWEPLEQLIALTSGSVDKSCALIEKLEVDPQRMLANIEMTNGLIYAEKASFALAKSLGKTAAHEIVEKACKIALSQGKHLKEVLEGMQLQIDGIDALFKPENAVGNAVEWTEKIIQKYTNNYA